MLMNPVHVAIAKATDLIMTDLPIVYREPPDFTLLRERDAIKHIFDSEQRKVRSMDHDVCFQHSIVVADIKILLLPVDIL